MKKFFLVFFQKKVKKSFSLLNENTSMIFLFNSKIEYLKKLLKPYKLPN